MRALAFLLALVSVAIAALALSVDPAVPPVVTQAARIETRVVPVPVTVTATRTLTVPAWLETVMATTPQPTEVPTVTGTATQIWTAGDVEEQEETR